MTQVIILLACTVLSFFAARAISRKARQQKAEPSLQFQSACWTLSKLLLVIVAGGFLATNLLAGRLALIAFLLCIAATVAGNFTGTTAGRKKK